MDITQKIRNELLKRHEVSALFEAESNPGFAQTQTVLAQILNVDETMIALKALRSNFGSKSFTVEAHIYDSLEHKQRFEPKLKQKKKETT